MDDALTLMNDRLIDEGATIKEVVAIYHLLPSLVPLVRALTNTNE